MNRFAHSLRQLSSLPLKLLPAALPARLRTDDMAKEFLTSLMFLHSC